MSSYPEPDDDNNDDNDDNDIPEHSIDTSSLDGPIESDYNGSQSQEQDTQNDPETGNDAQDLSGDDDQAPADNTVDRADYIPEDDDRDFIPESDLQPSEQDGPPEETTSPPDDTDTTPQATPDSEPAEQPIEPKHTDDEVQDQQAQLANPLPLPKDEVPNQINIIYDKLLELREKLIQHTFYAPDRDDLTKKIALVYAEIGDHVHDDVELRWIPPYKKPTADKLAEYLDTYIGYLCPQYIEDWPLSREQLNPLYDAIEAAEEHIEDMDKFPYAYTELEIKERHGKENLISVGIPDDVPEDEVDDPEEWYAGRRGVNLMSTVHREDPSCALHIGTDTRTGLDVSVDKSNLFVHRAIFGQTGKGKSTLLTNNFRALMETGAGGCFIDPKGDDSKRLLQILPEDRLDDVIWIEPGASGDHISGFNFISTNVTPESPNFDTIVSNLVEDMVKVLSAEDTWHTRMDRVARTLITVMNEYNRLTPDDTLDLNFVDMYYILKDEGSRNEFRALIEKTDIEFKAEYLDEIAEMEDDMLEPLLGRFLKWIQEPTTRRMIGFREESVNLSKAVENDKIIIVRMGMENKRLKKMIGTAVIRRIWSHIRSRANKERYNREPFYLFCDEFDNLVLQDDTIETMFSESRSYKLSLNCAMQYPSQVRDDVIDGVLNNAKTVHGYNPGRAKSARAFNTELGVEVDTLTDEADYHQWMRVDTNDGLERSDAFRVYTHPPFPPLRSAERAEEIRKQALKKHGRETPSTQKEKARLLFNKGQGRWETGMGQRVKEAGDPELEREYIRQMLAEAPEPQELPVRDTAGGDVGGGGSSTSAFSEVVGQGGPVGQGKAETLDNILEAVFSVRVQNGYSPTDYVPLEDVKEELRNRHGDLGYISDLGDALENASGQLIEQGEVSGGMALRLTPDGRERVLSHDSGADSSGGGVKHRYLCGEAFVMASVLGYQAAVPSQDGEGELPDATGEPPISLEQASSFSEMEQLKEKVEREYPAVAALSDGKPLTMEIETSTFEKPIRTITNLRKAVNAGRHCLFVVPDGSNADDLPKSYKDDSFDFYAKQVERLFNDFEYDRERGDSNIDRSELILANTADDDGNRKFYNHSQNHRSAEGHRLLRPEPDGRGDTNWVEDNGDIVATDRTNGEIARFEDTQEALNPPLSKVTYLEHDPESDEWIVRDGDQKHVYGSEGEVMDKWSKYKAPYIPDVEFDEWPTAEDFDIVVMPDDDNDQYDQPQLYVEGEFKPLYETLGEDLEPPTVKIGVNDSGEEAQSEAGESEDDVEDDTDAPPESEADQPAGDALDDSNPTDSTEEEVRDGTKAVMEINQQADPVNDPDEDEQDTLHINGAGNEQATTSPPDEPEPDTDDTPTDPDAEVATTADSAENTTTQSPAKGPRRLTVTTVEADELAGEELLEQMPLSDENEQEILEEVNNLMDDPRTEGLNRQTLTTKKLRYHYNEDDHGKLIDPDERVDVARPDESPKTAILTNDELRERLDPTESQRRKIGRKIEEHTVKKVSDLTADEIERRELLRYYTPNTDDLGVEIVESAPVDTDATEDTVSVTEDPLLQSGRKDNGAKTSDGETQPTDSHEESRKDEPDEKRGDDSVLAQLNTNCKECGIDDWFEADNERLECGHCNKHPHRMREIELRNELDRF